MPSLPRFPGTRAKLRRRSVVTAAGQLLEGTYLEHLVEHRYPVPTWATLNAAAHGRPGWVRAVAARARHTPGAPGDPLATASAICAELLEAVGDDDVLLAATQARLLVPLELQLMALGRPAGRSSGVVASIRSVLTPGQH